MIKSATKDISFSKTSKFIIDLDKRNKAVLSFYCFTDLTESRYGYKFKDP